MNLKQIPVNMKIYLCNIKLYIYLIYESDFKGNIKKQRKSELPKSRLQRSSKSKLYKTFQISPFITS